MQMQMQMECTGRARDLGAGPIRLRNSSDSARGKSILAMAGAHEHKATATNKAATARQPRGNRHRRRSVRDPAEAQDFFRPQVIFVIFPAAICRSVVCHPVLAASFPFNSHGHFLSFSFFEQARFLPFPLSTPQHTCSWLSTNSAHVAQINVIASTALGPCHKSRLVSPSALVLRRFVFVARPRCGSDKLRLVNSVAPVIVHYRLPLLS